MILNENELYQTLRKFFGFSEFKGLQKEAIGALLSGRDTFVIMPTGGGKSLCYQLPALMCEGTAIVISPLIALMKNQVDAIRSQSAVSGIAHVLNSSLTKTETQAVINDLKSGVTKLLFVAPESLTKQHNIDLLKSIPLSFVAIDEAHCISEWGHDFRPEYRNIRAIIDRLSPGIPLIALTATATPKVQEDIMKNLGMKDALLLKSSFNRPNLYYEVRPKTDEVNSDIVKLIAQHSNKSVIIYCLSRKKVEELAQILQLNGIKAIPYHAGFDAKTRALYQDQFLMEDVDVVVATIAFGMGIDKPDVRLVIHYDMPKSIESYYQETGRAGRDGGEGICIAFYSSKDIEKLEKFSSGKPVAEQEVSQALLQDVIAYAETSLSRRKFILHYFGEEFDEVNGEGAEMDDNARNPKELFEAGEEAALVLDVIQKTSEKFKSKEIVRILRGKPNAMISSHKTDEKPFFGCGHAHKSFFWHALVRQLVIAGYLRKSIESYGILQITEKGYVFIEKPSSFQMVLDRDYDKEVAEINQEKSKGVGADYQLLSLLKALRKKEADKHGVPPYIILQDPSLEDMSLKYPTNLEELGQIHGVGDAKAKRYGQPFVNFIANYVEENDIIKPDELVVKSAGSNSGLKLYIIQSVDRKLAFDDIASSKGITQEELLQTMEQIVFSGTKLDIGYWVDELLDDDSQEELHDYFIEASSNSLEDAIAELEEDFEEEEIRLFRIKFYSEQAI